MRKKVLISAPYFQPVVDDYKEVFEQNDIETVVPPVRERLSEAELLSMIEGIDGVIGGDDKFTARVFEKADRLKVISKWGTGIDSIDEEVAGRLGISVMNTPNAFTDPVADSALGYILCFARNIHRMDKDIKQGEWVKPMGISLGECTLGVVGVGNIGQAVIRRAVSFGMRVVGVDPVQPPEAFVAETGTRMVGLDQLLETSDFVSLNCTLNPSSHHLIGPAAFRQMKSTAYLVNTARGPLIDTTALAEALIGGEIMGAGLDVYEDEPLPDDSPLRRLDNCLLGSHNSNSSPSAWKRVHENTLKNLLDVLQDTNGADR